MEDNLNEVSCFELFLIQKIEVPSLDLYSKYSTWDTAWQVPLQSPQVVDGGTCGMVLMGQVVCSNLS